MGGEIGAEEGWIEPLLRRGGGLWRVRRLCCRTHWDCLLFRFGGLKPRWRKGWVETFVGRLIVVDGVSVGVDGGGGMGRVDDVDLACVDAARHKERVL